MTSRTYKPAPQKGGLDTVVISGARGDFLINRSEISSSIYQNAGDFPRYGTSMFHPFAYRSTTVLLLDFDYYLKQYFSFTPGGDSCIVLFFTIRPDSPLAAGVASFRESGTYADIDTGTAAIKLTGTAALHKVPLGEFSFFPGPLRATLEQQGILCLRFTDNAGIQYLIDLHSLFTVQLTLQETQDCTI